jgi:uncharacterized protein (UPF0332 family)
MSFNWSDLLVLATELGNRGTNEADLRSSINRAYFASHCIARKYLRDDENDINLNYKVYFKELRVGYHTYVINTFLESNDSNKQDIGRDLERLFDNRKKADYKDLIHPNISFIQNMAQISINMANNINDKINDLKSI